MSEKQKYIYNGPIYFKGRKQYNNKIYGTFAKSRQQAINNIIYKIAAGDIKNIKYYDIDDSKLKLEPTEIGPADLKPVKIIRRCDKCEYQLNDQGECPICDLGEEDLLDNI